MAALTLKEVFFAESRKKFDLKKFLALPRNNADRVRYLRYIDVNQPKSLKPLGVGSSRIAIAIDSSKVMKHAINQKGIAQNEAEIDFYTNPAIKPIFAKIYNYDPSYSWIISELVRPIKDKQEFEDLTGISFDDFTKRMIYGKWRFDTEIEDDESLKNNPGFVRSVKTAVGSFGLSDGDITKISSWGKTSDGRAVLLDYGLTDNIWKRYYS